MPECTDDSLWTTDGGQVAAKTDCVSWADLIKIRQDYNDLWDLLNLEFRAPGVKYGFSSGGLENKKEQTSALATANGFFSLRFDETGVCDEIFYLTPRPIGDSTTIGNRLMNMPVHYSYYDDPSTYGPWVVYLTDPCYGCTGFGLQALDIPYDLGRKIVCNGADVMIDAEVMSGHCIWAPEGCDPLRMNTLPSGICNFNFDWRSEAYSKLVPIAEDMFQKTQCMPAGSLCQDFVEMCCNVYMAAYYTEEWNTPEDGCSGEGEVFRRLKYVTMGIDSGGEGVFKGIVTQVIKAAHLSEITDRVKYALDNKPLRHCSYDQCGEPKSVWERSETVHTIVSSGSCIGQRPTADPGSCSVCETSPAFGGVICACQFNEISHIINKYLASTCQCADTSNAYFGQTLVGFGSLSDCDCCVGRCCKDCGCGEDLVSEADCLAQGSTSGNGPVWIGTYADGESIGNSKLGTQKPCGCYELGEPFYDTYDALQCRQICGAQSCGVCSPSVINPDNCECVCCPDETGCSYGVDCGCCQKDYRPQRNAFTGECECVSDPCPTSGSGGSGFGWLK